MIDTKSCQQTALQTNCNQGKSSPPFLERVVRTNLAALYQILALMKMDEHTYTHVSARIPGTDSYFIYPFGFLFEEVTARSLMKIRMDGVILEGTEYQCNRTGYIIHGNIYRARPEINTIIHLHTPATIAVSAMQEGLLPISQWALHFYDSIAYHQYNSLSLDNSVHGNSLINDLGAKRTMLLQNHGLIACGVTPHEALFYVHHLELACQAQCYAMSNRKDLILPNEEICKKAHRDLLSFEKDIGYRDWLAWMRKLDRMGIIYDDWDI